MADEVPLLDAARSAQDVLDGLKAGIRSEGFQQQLDDRHWVTFIDRGPRLLVSFEPFEITLATDVTGLPLGVEFVRDKDWSLLHFSNCGETWFRSEAVYEFLDGLVDDCFFEDFDQVAFYGVGTSGYAAAAFSVASPGANVIAVRPQATLDTARAGWDNRFPEARRLRFDDRYGYAPDMLQGAGSAVILYDPHEHLDAVHASLFRGPNVMPLKCRHFRDSIDLTLKQMDLLHEVIERAAEGALTEQAFYKMLRARRNHSRYLRSFVYHVDREQQPLRTAVVCAHVLQRINGPAFRRKLAGARDKLAARGKAPGWLLDFQIPD